jgi:FkbM family methyltransferase
MPETDLTQWDGWWIRSRRDLAEQDRNVIGEVLPDGYRLKLRNIIANKEMFVVDVGAHIGAFARCIHQRNPAAEIVCVEACPENIPALKANTRGFLGSVIHAACTYEPGEIELLNSVKENGTATGGSIVAVKAETPEPFEPNPNLYWRDDRPLRKVTLEQITANAGRDRIDVLKLDCEGSEFSILANADVSRIGFICGEYHGEERWEPFVKERFADWGYSVHHRAGGLGIFHLQNPGWCTV